MASSRDNETIGPPARVDRRALRQRGTRDEIVAAAWELARTHGLAGLSMRDLGEQVGMRAQSIYSYFASKNEIYDAMFLDGCLAHNAAMAETTEDTSRRQLDARSTIRRQARRFVTFCTSDPVRHQLLFQRTIPGFVPSEASYAVAVAGYEGMTSQLAELGITDPEAVDLLTALLSGLAAQQVANDPGGDRWERLVDRAVDMFLKDAAPALLQITSTRKKRT